jgi:uroporphyrinogen III methyltransferase/synthase
VTVYLVGAGPGDPGLITVRGAELLAKADVVVFDRLVSRALVDLAPPRAQRIDVGKRPGQTDGSGQAEINELLVRMGAGERLVVRLKGGDPYVFGRGAEEAEALRAAGVDFEVVPGVSSAFAVPAAAGVPVTHRDLSRSVTVVAGHIARASQAQPGAGEAPKVDWEALARTGGTLVVMMGMESRREIAERLVSGGLPPKTPVLVVQDGTTPRQRSSRCTLGTLADVELDPPAIIVIGAVAEMDLSSSGGPLAGKTVVVTRPRGREGTLPEDLREAGARVVLMPVSVLTEPPDGGAALAAAARSAQAGRYSWLAFTSANAVESFAKTLDGPIHPSTRVAAVGEATRAELAAHGLEADVVAGTSTGAQLARSIRAASATSGAASGPVLLPRSHIGREELASILRRDGFEVEEVVAYWTVRADASSGLTPEAIEEASRADIVTFASPSSVRFYLEATKGHGRPKLVACIGPTTSRAAVECGLEVDVEAAEHSSCGLVRAICDYVRAAR